MSTLSSTKKAILCLLAVTIFMCATANPVDINRARQAGTNYLTAKGHRNAAELTLVSTPFSNIHVFNAEGQGFVIVAADDCVRPILGYSLTSTFKADKMPTNIQGWLEDLDNIITRVKDALQQEKTSNNHFFNNSTIKTEWQQLLAGSIAVPQRTGVSPLLTTTWNQDPLYNALCPFDSIHNENTVTGCVATAMAQIMKYWNYPTSGIGSHIYNSQYGTLFANFGGTTYDWEHMPSALTPASSPAEISAVATLMYHAGVAIEMIYGVASTGGSGSFVVSYDGSGTPSAVNALMKYFKYAPTISLVSRGCYSDSAFAAILQAELSQGRPIMFEGSDLDGGHCFICDGYNDGNYFHINWGWGGFCDGFYMMGALNPAPGGTGSTLSSTYNNGNIAVIGIQPNNLFGNSGTISLSTYGGDSTCSVSGAGSYNFLQDATIFASAGDNYVLDHWSDNSTINKRYFIMSGGDISLTAYFRPIEGDTISYCNNNGQCTRRGEVEEGHDQYWGIKIPSSVLTPGRALSAIDFFAVAEGLYDVTVYSGTTAPTDTIFSTSTWVNNNEIQDWLPFFLDPPYIVEQGKSIWITLHNSDVPFPAASALGCGNPNGMLYGPEFNPDDYWNAFSFMIRGIFVNPSIAVSGDTLSYCDKKPVNGSFLAPEWGIMIPANELKDRNYLKCVDIFSEYSEIFTMRIYRGGNNAPETLVHTQYASLNNRGWQEIVLDTLLTLDTLSNLWITFSSPDLAWPAASCRFTGNDNGSWIMGFDDQWWNIRDYFGMNATWMIKAITSATEPTIPGPTLIFNTPSNFGINSSLTISAYHTTSASVSWEIEGMTPETYSGDSVTVEWSQPGHYIITATATNSYGSTTQKRRIAVFECNQPLTYFPYEQGFEKNNNFVCEEVVDADGDGDGWEIDIFNANHGNRSFLSNVLTWNGQDYETTPADNWLILPTMRFRETASYTINWFSMIHTGPQFPQSHYAVYIDTSTSNILENFILLAEFTEQNESWEQKSLDLSAYSGKTIRLAFRHLPQDGDCNLYLDDIVVHETIPFFHDGDTLSYCGYHFSERLLAFGSPTYWGILLTTNELTDGCDSLGSVLLYTVTEGDYTLHISQGGLNHPSADIYTETKPLSPGWNVYSFNHAIAINSSRTLWITFSSSASFPAAYTASSGSVNGDWISDNGTNWYHCALWGYDMAWMIKAVVKSVGGHNNGIDLADSPEKPTIIGIAGGIMVTDATHEDVRVYDIMGRLIVSKPCDNGVIPVPAAGVYVVKVGNRPAQKIVIVN